MRMYGICNLNIGFEHKILWNFQRIIIVALILTLFINYVVAGRLKHPALPDWNTSHGGVEIKFHAAQCQFIIFKFWKGHSNQNNLMIITNLCYVTEYCYWLGKLRAHVFNYIGYTVRVWNKPSHQLVWIHSIKWRWVKLWMWKLYMSANVAWCLKCFIGIISIPRVIFVACTNLHIKWKNMMLRSMISLWCCRRM